MYRLIVVVLCKELPDSTRIPRKIPGTPQPNPVQLVHRDSTLTNLVFQVIVFAVIQEQELTWLLHSLEFFQQLHQQR